MTEKQIQMAILIQDIILAFVITTAATILGGGFTSTSAYLVGMMEAFSINYIAGLFIPVERIGCTVANAIRLKKGSLPYKLVKIFLSNAIFVTIVSFTIALINVGPVPEIGKIWISTYPVLHLVGLITSILIDEQVKNLARIICS